MSSHLRHRTAASVLGALAAAVTLTATASPALATTDLAEPVSVFPTNDLTVPDRQQLTGLRVALPTEGCGNPIVCGLVERLNELDGFDLDPRIAVRFDASVDPAAVAERIIVRQERGGWRTGVDRVVWDPATNTLYAHPVEQLAPGTTYRIDVQAGPANAATSETFTTLSATDGLLDINRQIQSDRALREVGIGRPGLEIDAVVPVAGSTVTFVPDRPAPVVPGGTPGGPSLQPTGLLPAGSTLVFGSYEAPSWLRDDVTIAQTPTRDQGPAPVEAERLPFVAVLPAGPAPAGGWPTAAFGHGFTGSTTSVFLAAITNAKSGIATIGTNVVGHGFGPESTWQITTADGGTQTIPTYGRGVDQNGDGLFGSTEGSSATGGGAAVNSRDALRQTAADIMTLVRSVGGTDVDGDRRPDLSGARVTYFGQSFGGIYGTMLAGADRAVARSVLNVPGGPINDIARLSPAFRPLTFQALRAAGLAPNSPDASRWFFEEQLPLRGEAPVTATVPGAVAIQDYLAKANWLTRPGSPETFAPLIRDDRVLVQVAYGDQTVPNPTSYTLVDAGDLWSRTSLFRNDRATTAALNPHGFLLDVLRFPVAAMQAQGQVAAFLGRGEVVDPDADGPVWEVPISDPDLLRSLNFPGRG